MTTTTRNVTILDRPDIREASVSLHGVHSEQTERRGVEIVATVLWVDGGTTIRLYDFIAGHNVEDDHGGHDLDQPFWAHRLDEAAEWLKSEYEPPCSPGA